MIWKKDSFLLLNICFGYLLESPQGGDINKYPKHMFLEALLNTMFLHNFRIDCDTKASQIILGMNFILGDFIDV